MQQYVSYKALPKAKLASAEYNILRSSSLELFHIDGMFIQREGVSKYAAAKRLWISEKMLRDWTAKDLVILSQRSAQRKGTIGRAASLPQLEDYLHERFLEMRIQGIKVKRAWFFAEGKKWYIPSM